MDTLKMRPFSQSILLMPQGAKKYYLHTDIFMFSPGMSDNNTSLVLLICQHPRTLMTMMAHRK
jgi:hypothetical protein